MTRLRGEPIVHAPIMRREHHGNEVNDPSPSRAEISWALRLARCSQCLALSWFSLQLVGLRRIPHTIERRSLAVSSPSSACTRTISRLHSAVRTSSMASPTSLTRRGLGGRLRFLRTDACGACSRPATSALRAEGKGHTLIVSPLPALMRDHVSAALQAGLRSE